MADAFDVDAPASDRERAQHRGIRSAFGDVGQDDLVIVADTQRPFLERHRDFAGLWDVWPRLDLLVYTPAELEQMQSEGNPFIEQVFAEGRVVYEAAEG